LYSLKKLVTCAAVAVAAGSLGIAIPALARPGPAHGNELIKVTTPSPMIVPKVTATGVINDAGSAYSPSRPQSWYTLKLSRGSVRYSWKVTASSQGQNLKTCTRTYRELGTFTLSDGKGSYRHLYGTGRYVAHGVNIGEKRPDGTCFFTPDESGTTTIARGSVTYAPDQS
jgi:hypothetical protein